ncbi:nitroreductase [Pseudarthrobacter sp. W1I19]|uniref:nitroreductase n=1 Tax=Pseudarthrobacter sp. W1I19 TaxID=3042288 RepID=UPI0027858394|nr:nitroreductase [Pseudarthrobacter sp. W1I19]MDQ0923845.1 nitroreductase [Pseudarthrobacter sp. W1I19]
MRNLEKNPLAVKRFVPWRRDTFMSVEDAINSRRSVRAFLPTPVPETEVERLLALAARAASNSNSQPWQVHVVTGEAKAALTAALLEAHDNQDRVENEYPYQPRPDEWIEPFRSRRRQFGDLLYRETLGISATDTPARLMHHRRNYDFFGAPVGIFVTIGRSSLGGGLLDAGLFLQSLMLAARASGLDTCTQASFIDFHPVLRLHMRIPEDQLIVCGVSLGYADPRHRLNRLATTRECVDSFVTFHTEPGQNGNTLSASSQQ